MKNIIEKLIGSKARYKQYKKDKLSLPADYQEALAALEKYMWNFAKGDNFMVVLEDVLEIFQESSIEHIPVSEIVNHDPVEFADTIMEQYPETLWLIKIREKLRKDIKEIGD
ncbi:DUF1048 domain-containing protein [Listeria ilorinensis]|uniref:DUF1048 domain-containing protein n=1 Tax=Listeria ilorinensis TaxID=2867439 RepID=UPI001EF4A945|nr:DUF1048 domain-containing protein [Listeria ilorinensis]